MRMGRNLRIRKDNVNQMEAHEAPTNITTKLTERLLGQVPGLGILGVDVEVYVELAEAEAVKGILHAGNDLGHGGLDVLVRPLQDDFVVDLQQQLEAKLHEDRAGEREEDGELIEG